MWWFLAVGAALGAEIDVVRQTWWARRDGYAFGRVRVSGCWFVECRVSEGAGGAILSLAPMDVRDSVFYHCAAGKGAGFCAHSDLRMSGTVFVRCVARESGSAFVAKFGKACVNSSRVVFCATGEYAGCDFKGASVDCCWSNVSYCSAGVGASAMCCRSNHVNMRSSIVSFCRNYQALGSVALFDAEIFMSEMVFSKCSNDAAGAAALAITTNSPQTAQLEKCVFYRCSQQGAYKSVIQQGTAMVCFSDCQFSEPKQVELQGPNLQITDTTKFALATFERKDIPQIRLFFAPYAVMPSILVAEVLIDAVRIASFRTVSLFISLVFLANFIYLAYKSRQRHRPRPTT